ncbi:orotate phosphoribosyltransferase [Chitinispirillales bacterium ANBcel5]|uniref:orotate phosphoribosyltransferase n=1 Tax=Cellulosispirillum alkaliphilum TaxID=3039283 RepID=UPI002A526924|nr:orotate phosphoribosyltransferase [Chitinispirillales bacterium ANBcel5]
MEQYKKEFIEFMVRSNVLTFGDFVTKSGRRTPFFINTGNYSTGEQLNKLGQFYAEALNRRLGTSFDVLFGPAYKGIPLAVTTSVALCSHFSHNVSFCFNRKEAKDHGEGGTIVGCKLKENLKVVIIEDVTTAGTSVRESIPLLQATATVRVKGLVVSVDRMEKGTGEKSALCELKDEFGIDAFSIVTLDEIVSYLYKREIDGMIVLDESVYARIEEYRAKYGAKC